MVQASGSPRRLGVGLVALAAVQGTFGQAYSEDIAVDLVGLSTAAYCEEGSIETWMCGLPCGPPPFQDVRVIRNKTTTAFAFVGRRLDKCLVVFRGSATDAAFNDDADSVAKQVKWPGCSFDGKECRVGVGYLEEYESIRSQIADALVAVGCAPPAPVTFTGHSLGGILATMAAFDLRQSGIVPEKIYTFGMMKAGDPTFAQALNQRLAGVPNFRVTRKDDPAAYSPQPHELGAEWAHGGREIYYPGSTNSFRPEWGYHVCDDSIAGDPQCATKGRSTVATYIAQCKASPEWCGHMRYLEPRLHYKTMSASCDSSMQITII